LTRFEPFDEPVASRCEFLKRLLIRLVAALGVIVLVMLLGAILFFPHECKKDSLGEALQNKECLKLALHNAAMPLSGMGPAGGERGEIEERLRVDFYVLFSGIVMAAALGLALAPPVFHRVVHHSYPGAKEPKSTAAAPGAKPDRKDGWC
jgi:hypothetical protein